MLVHTVGTHGTLAEFWTVWEKLEQANSPHIQKQGVYTPLYTPVYRDLFKCRKAPEIQCLGGKKKNHKASLFLVS